MAKEIETGTTCQVLGEILNKGIVAQMGKEIDALIQKNRNNQFLQDKLERLKAHSQYISSAFDQHQNTAPSENIEYCLKRMREAIRKVNALINAQSQSEEEGGSSSSTSNALIDVQPQPQEGSSVSTSNALIDAQSQPQERSRYWNAFIDAPSQLQQRSKSWMSKVLNARKIRDLNAELKQLYEDIDEDFSILANFRRAMVPLSSPAWLQSSAYAPPQETDVLLQPMAEAGLLGCATESNETRFQIVPASLPQSSAMPQSIWIQLQIVLATQPQSSETLPPQSSASVFPQETESAFVGEAIKSAETQLKSWINAETPQVRAIAVYGMPGVGKTRLLERVYNFYKHNDVFDSVIWLTVPRKYEIRDLQGRIAEQLGFNLSGISDREADAPKRILCESLNNKKFLLILDDLWKQLDLNELGVASGTDKGSKAVFSTRSRDLVLTSRDLVLTEAEQSIHVKPLSKHEGWELFERVAFEGGHVPEQLKDCARKIADECQGLPLAINVVAAVMRGKGTKVDDWNYCLSLIKL